MIFYEHTFLMHKFTSLFTPCLIVVDLHFILFILILPLLIAAGVLTAGDFLSLRGLHGLPNQLHSLPWINNVI